MAHLPCTFSRPAPKTPREKMGACSLPNGKDLLDLAVGAGIMGMCKTRGGGTGDTGFGCRTVVETPGHSLEPALERARGVLVEGGDGGILGYRAGLNLSSY